MPPAEPSTSKKRSSALNTYSSQMNIQQQSAHPTAGGIQIQYTGSPYYNAQVSGSGIQIQTRPMTTASFVTPQIQLSSSHHFWQPWATAMAQAGFYDPFASPASSKWMISDLEDLIEQWDMEDCKAVFDRLMHDIDWDIFTRRSPTIINFINQSQSHSSTNAAALWATAAQTRGLYLRHGAQLHNLFENVPLPFGQTRLQSVKDVVSHMLFFFMAFSQADAQEVETALLNNGK